MAMIGRKPYYASIPPGIPRPDLGMMADVGLGAAPMDQLAMDPAMAMAPPPPPSALETMAAGLPDIPEPAPKKAGINWLGVLADALSGAAGQPGQYAAGIRRDKEAENEQALWDKRYALQRRDHASDDTTNYNQSIALEQWKRDHPTTNDPDIATTLPNGQFYAGPRSGLAAVLGGGGGAGGPVGGGDLDATPTTEDGHTYTPGPGGRANPANWQSLGGQTPPASGGFR